ncbi:MAG: hypothetical protein HZB24_13340 [Desulfobacterales bacterium]|nr:hypothetical protein [Desulfobacterales bacterium]
MSKTVRPAPAQETKPLKPPSLAEEGAEAGSMEKIRDILFGNQVRDFERRFARMEEQLNNSSAGLRDEVTKRLEALERFFKEELETLKTRIKGEAEKRSDGEKRLGDELKTASATLGKAIQQTEEKLAEGTTDLRQQILRQSKELIGEIQAKSEQATKALAQAGERLEESKIDRATLAEYLVDMAMRLSDRPTAADAREGKS